MVAAHAASHLLVDDSGSSDRFDSQRVGVVSCLTRYSATPTTRLGSVCGDNLDVGLFVWTWYVSISTSFTIFDHCFSLFHFTEMSIEFVW
jgi:hypothetical protein